MQIGSRYFKCEKGNIFSEGRNELTESRKLWETKRDEGKREWGLQGQRRKRNKIKPVGKERPGKSAEEREK